MKAQLLSILFFLILIPGFSQELIINKTAQPNSGEYVAKEIYKNDKAKQHSLLCHKSLMNNHIDWSKDVDTVFFEFKNWRVFRDLLFFSHTASYSTHDVTWLNDSTAYLIVNSGQFTLFDQYIIGKKMIYNIRENIEVNSSTNIILSPKEKNLIEITGFDEFGDPLKLHNGYTIKKMVLGFFANKGYQVFSSSYFAHDDTIYISDFSSNIDMHLSFLHFDVKNSKKNYLIDFPIYQGLSDSIALSNNPSDYLSCHAKFKLPSNIVNEDVYFGMLSGVKRLAVTGAFTFGSFARLTKLDHLGKYWEGEIFLDFHQNNKICSFTGFELLSDSYEISSKGICEYDNKMAVNFFMDKNSSTQYFQTGDTLYLNEDLNFISSWHVNDVRPNQNVHIWANKVGVLLENHYTDVQITLIKDELDTISVENSRFLGTNVENGSYKVVKEGLNYTNGQYSGNLVEVSEFEMGGNDANPPIMDMIKVLDSGGRILYRANKNQECSLHFWLRDIGFDIDTTYNMYISRVEPLNNQLTRAYAKLHTEGEWIEMDLTLVSEDTVAGAYYMSDISEFINVDAGALDFKIEFVDLHGNKTTSLIEPFLLIGESSIGVEDRYTPAKAAQVNSFPNPFSKETTIEYVLDDVSDVQIGITNIYGKKVYSLEEVLLGKGLNKFTWDGKNMNNQEAEPGVYVISIKTNGKDYLSKVLKLK